MAPSHRQCGGKEDKRSGDGSQEGYIGATRSPHNFLVSYWEDSCIVVCRNSLLTVVAVEEVCNVTGSLGKGREPDN